MNVNEFKNDCLHKLSKENKTPFLVANLKASTLIKL